MTKKDKPVSLNPKQRNFLSSLENEMCNVSGACGETGIARSTFYNWVKTNPVFAEAVLDARESIIDRCESQLYKSIFEDENITSMIFFLKTQGKKRGWSERFDVELERETKTLFQSADDKKLIAETRRKLALLDLLLVTKDQDKKLKLLAEFHSGNNN